jgi:uncharacterized protein DUF1116
VVASLADRIAAANDLAMCRLNSAAPVLIGIREARLAIPTLDGQSLLHAGPPLMPPSPCGPMRGAIVGAALYEGWARSAPEAEALLESGAMALRCTHDASAVGPMAGIISPSMPLLEVRDIEHGATAYAPLNEGVGAVLRFGANDAGVVCRLRWLQNELGPALDAAVRRLGGLPLIPLIARALTMGDELHQRNVAASGLFFRAVAPALAEVVSGPTLSRVLGFLAQTDQFFLNIAMAASKAMLASSEDIPYCTLVTAMSRNGVEFGIRVSGLGARWFTAPAPPPAGMYFPGFTAEDANLDMGDSAIVETAGLGGMAMAASPAVVGFVGMASVREALATTQAMADITLAPSPYFKIPALDFAGAPTGIELRSVVRLGVVPVINTGIAHRLAGMGQIGAGIVRAPLPAFQNALAAFAVRYAASDKDATAPAESRARNGGG